MTADANPYGAGSDDDRPTIAADLGGYELWMDDALCAETDPEVFFPDKSGSTRDAKAVCAACTVAAECLDYALAHEQRFGIWGGLSERERRNLARLLNFPTKPEDDDTADLDNHLETA